MLLLPRTLSCLLARSAFVSPLFNLVSKHEVWHSVCTLCVNAFYGEVDKLHYVRIEQINFAFGVYFELAGASAVAAAVHTACRLLKELQFHSIHT